MSALVSVSLPGLGTGPRITAGHLAGVPLLDRNADGEDLAGVDALTVGGQARRFADPQFSLHGSGARLHLLGFRSDRLDRDPVEFLQCVDAGVPWLCPSFSRRTVSRESPRTSIQGTYTDSSWQTRGCRPAKPACNLDSPFTGAVLHWLTDVQGIVKGSMERTATVRALLRSFFDSTEFTGLWRSSDLSGLRGLWVVSTPVNVGWFGVLGSSICDWSR